MVVQKKKHQSLHIYRLMIFNCMRNVQEMGIYKNLFTSVTNAERWVHNAVECFYKIRWRLYQITKF